MSDSRPKGVMLASTYRIYLRIGAHRNHNKRKRLIMPENPIIVAMDSLESKGFIRETLSGMFFKRGTQRVEVLHDGYVWML